MKKHAIIPIFIPHLGCPEKCVFCDQIAITARRGPVSSHEVRGIIERNLSTLEGLSSEDIEIAFYGGSFTGIPAELQEEYLSVGKEYLDAGSVSGLHLSTRPDYIDEEVLERLKAYGVSVIELGVQSFDDRVLSLSKRGHDSSSVYRACEMIRNWGFRLGIQLMIGLPGDTPEKAEFSAREAAGLKPELARLYPTVILPGTELYRMYEEGSYTPLSRDEAVDITARMYSILKNAGVKIMRVGLKSTDIINSPSLGEINSGTYHPAFRQLVEGKIAREEIEKLLMTLDSEVPDLVTVFSNPAWLSAAAGHGGENRRYFVEKYRSL